MTANKMMMGVSDTHVVTVVMVVVMDTTSVYMTQHMVNQVMAHGACVVATVRVCMLMTMVIVNVMV